MERSIIWIYKNKGKAGKRMRKKKVFALAMAGCMMFTQPVFAEELQKELTDAVVIADDAQKEGNLDVLSEDGREKRFL